MIISEGCERIMQQDLISFLKENEFSGLRLRLLLFWVRHPQAKFSLDCIAHVLDITCHSLREILRELVAKGMVNEQYCTSGITHYSLNHDHELSMHVQHLAGMDWSAIKNLEGEIEREAALA
jgi:Fe2+ or Zn2+ uptake regulation protein